MHNLEIFFNLEYLFLGKFFRVEVPARTQWIYSFLFIGILSVLIYSSPMYFLSFKHVLSLLEPKFLNIFLLLQPIFVNVKLPFLSLNCFFQRGTGFYCLMLLHLREFIIKVNY